MNYRRPKDLKMRKQFKKKKRIRTKDLNCVVCKKETCVDDVPKIVCRINPDYTRVTRSITQKIKSMDDFIIIEIYRCMPLLGNEEQLLPPWNIHIGHFAIVFTNLT